MKRLLILTAISTLAISLALPLIAAAPSGKAYATPEKAVDAFVNALRKNDNKGLIAIFGKGSERLFEAEDPVTEQNVREDFLKFYDAFHEIIRRGDGSRLLTVGAIKWSFPIPLVESKGRWAFDTEAGADEIISRRIGRNELNTIQTVLAVADAQREYFLTDRDADGILEYAQSFRSTGGLRNGLFWPVEDGEPLSPLGLFAAQAADEGYPPASGAYHGYHYKMLSSQGPSAPGGAYDYLAHGNQIGGFALAAWPAAYGESGIMTFLLSHSGDVYQKDLGPNTEAEAMKLTVFDPGDGWTKVSDNDLAPLPADAP